jgi:hypothetical protein
MLEGEVTDKPFRPSLAEMWDAFLRTSLPAGAPATQITEMRKAFYTGAWAVFQVLTRVGLDDGVEATKADLEYMDRLDTEMKAFITELTPAAPLASAPGVRS